MELDLSCELNSINNLKLFSYFMPDKFDIKHLQTADRISDITALFLNFLNKDIHTYNLYCKNNKVNAKIVSNDQQKNNFGILSSRTLSGLNICYNWTNQLTQLTFITDKQIEYSNCNIVNLKINPVTYKLKCIIAQMTYGNQDYLMYDVDNFCIAIVSHDNKHVCNRILQRI